MNENVMNSESAGTLQQSPVNDIQINGSRGFSSYALPHQVNCTLRFGEISPFLVYDSVAKDMLKYSSGHSIRSYTLASPMYTDVRINKAVFSVPLAVIKPHTYEVLAKNPTHGKDVNFPQVNTCLNVVTFGSGMIDLFQTLLAKPTPTDAEANAVMYSFMLFNKIFTSGQIMDMTEFRIRNRNAGMNWEREYETALQKSVIKDLTPIDIEVTDDSVGGTFVYQFDCRSIESLRKSFWYLYHCPFSWKVKDDADNRTRLFRWLNNDAGGQSIGTILQFYQALLSLQPQDKFINIERLIAYQLACVQYFSNGNVDDVYTSKQWHETQKSIIYNLMVAMNQFNYKFEYQGRYCEYDSCSGSMMNRALVFFNNGVASQSYWTTENIQLAYIYLNNIFTTNVTLRYGDYFAGAKLSPLAVGDTDVAVSNEKVSVIDITKSISYQRFLNAVNRVKSDIVSYLKSMTGVTPSEVEGHPLWICKESNPIGKDIVANTAENTGQLFTNLQDFRGKYLFQTDFRDEGVVIGLAYVDALPCYDSTQSKFFRHIERYDYFNSMLQTIGDQPVEQLELTGGVDVQNINYGYQVRNAEYKFVKNLACGGFRSGALPSWCMIYDVEDRMNQYLNEYSIRLHPSDFDEFYSSLSGISSGYYFHFIISFSNVVDANRSMIMQPDIL